jgi:hypothetical protein
MGICHHLYDGSVEVCYPREKDSEDACVLPGANKLCDTA